MFEWIQKFMLPRSHLLISDRMNKKILKLLVDPTLTLIALVKTATAYHLLKKTKHLHYIVAIKIISNRVVPIYINIILYLSPQFVHSL